MTKQNTAINIYKTTETRSNCIVHRSTTKSKERHQTNMGNSDSKDQDVKQIGDQQVTLIENQEVHTEYHTQHEWKLLIILAAVVTLLILKVLKLTWRFCKKQAFKTARSVATIQQV